MEDWQCIDLQKITLARAYRIHRSVEIVSAVFSQNLHPVHSKVTIVCRSALPSHRSCDVGWGWAPVSRRRPVSCCRPISCENREVRTASAIERNVLIDWLRNFLDHYEWAAMSGKMI